MPAERKTNQSRRLTAAGLIAVTAATLLMMAWAIFPTAAFADGTMHGRARQSTGCRQRRIWIFRAQTTVTDSEPHVRNDTSPVIDSGSWTAIDVCGTPRSTALVSSRHCEDHDQPRHHETASTTQVNEGGAFSYTITVETSATRRRTSS